MSPFLEAAMSGNAVVQAAPAPAKKSRTAVRMETAAPAVAASSAAVAAVRPLTGGVSNPAWLILVFAGFAGLYFYLCGGVKKRRRK